MFVIRRPTTSGFQYLKHFRVRDSIDVMRATALDWTPQWVESPDGAAPFDTARSALQCIADNHWSGAVVEIVEFVEPEPAPRWVEKRVVA